MVEIRHESGEIENRPRSRGGKWFDRITYAGIAGVGTFFATIPIANLFNKGRSLHGVDQWLRKALPKIGATENFANKTVDTTNLMWGGNLTLIPVAWMEHHRTNIVNALNRMLGDPTDPNSVKAAPPQTIGSILKGRALAWGAVFGGLWSVSKAFPQAYENFQQKCGELYCKFRKAPLMEGGLPSKQFQTGRTAALDVFATASAATILYIASHFFATRASRKRDEKLHEKTGTQHGTGELPDPGARSEKTAQPLPEKPSTTVNEGKLEAPLAAISQAEQQPAL